MGGVYSLGFVQAWGCVVMRFSDFVIIGLAAISAWIGGEIIGAEMTRAIASQIAQDAWEARIYADGVEK